MNQTRIRLWLVIFLGLAITACSSGAPRVNCGRHLVPINRLTPAVKIEATKANTP